MTEQVIQLTKKILLFTIIACALFVLAGALVVFGILSPNFLAPGAYNAPFEPGLINQVFGASVIIMGFVTLDVGIYAVAGSKNEHLRRYFAIHDLVLGLVSFMGIICCAGHSCFGLIYLVDLVIAIALFAIAAKAGYPMDVK